MARRRAVIFGVTGQDGSYLSELLLEKGYDVTGVKRRTSTISTDRIDALLENSKFHLVYGDVRDAMRVSQIIHDVSPDEVYNLAAMSHVRVSFDVPSETFDINAIGAANVLEACRIHSKKSRIYQASSSEMFGNADPPQCETTQMIPVSPYGCSKLFAHSVARMYRESHGMFVACGILFNHESPRRGETFVTRKITIAASRIKLRMQKHLYLGNLNARRDWGHARDYVRAMWMMIQHDSPDDFVIASGEDHSVREFLSLAFDRVGLSVDDHVKFDERLLRPTEINCLLGNADRARQTLGWEPQVSFSDLVRDMIDSDLAAAVSKRSL